MKRTANGALRPLLSETLVYTTPYIGMTAVLGFELFFSFRDEMLLATSVFLAPRSVHVELTDPRCLVGFPGLVLIGLPGLGSVRADLPSCPCTG